jgi:hypothetical protein
VCRLYTDALGIGGACGPSIGTLLPGETCNVGPVSLFTPDERCQNGICQANGRGRDQGTCSGLCETDLDCPVDHLCASGNLTIDGQGTPDRADDFDVPASLCVYVPGSQTSCAVEADCAADETCADAPLDGAFRGVCVTEVADGRAAGQGCNLSTACASTICQEGWYGLSYCTELCDDDTDCPADYECRTFEDDIRSPRDICMPADDPRGTPVP